MEILYLTLGKATKFLVKKLSPSEVINRKPHGGGGGGGGVENTPPPSALRVNCYSIDKNAK